ncbi:DUF3558 domain-containing protein [Pseudonocardia sp. CA-107938]|uniref:DUF3558 domain-containing protein n=1 Tax=Pseudonocardia sp. CA-107938 TaxID=3240021 RepID=UPI003D90AE5E
MRRIALLVLMSCLIAAGCAPVAGQPVSGPTAAPSGRPRDIRLDSIDPCSLFTPAVREQLGITRPLMAEKGSDSIYQGQVPSCGSRGDEGTRFAVGVAFALQDGVDVYRPDRVNGVVTPKRVAGFPALLVKQNKFTDECAVVVDVHPAQLLDVTYSDGGNQPQLAQDDLCTRAEQAADLLMGQLLQRA